MNNSLVFDGRKYISAKEAAKTFGYTSDYVGQLCRAQKINARLVGRSWYVLEKDLSNHKNSHHNAPTKDQSKNIKSTKKLTVDDLANNVRNELSIIKENKISRVDELGIHEILYSKDDQPLLPKIEKKVDLESARFVALDTIEKSIQSPKIRSPFEKLVVGFSLVATLLLFISGTWFEKENVKNLGIFDKANYAKLVGAYDPFLNAAAVSFADAVSGVRAIKSESTNMTASVFSSGWQSLTSWAKEKALAFIAPWNEKPSLAKEITPITPTSANAPAPLTLRGGAGTGNAGAGKALSVNFSGVAKEYVDLKIAELKNYFLTNPLAPNVNRYYVTRQNDSLVDDLSQPITSLDGATISNSTFSGSASLTSLSVSGNSNFAGATFTGSTTVSDLTATDWLAIGTTTRQDTLTLDGAFYLASKSAPANTSYRIYNTNGGDLYWNGSLIAGATVGNWTLSGSDVYRASGNVGIGSTTPGYKLSVSGSGFFARGTVT